MASNLQQGAQQPEQWLPWKQWHEQHPGGAFQTASSLSWFLKEHTAELESAGVLIPGRGRRPGLVEREGFGPAAVLILKRESARAR